MVEDVGGGQRHAEAGVVVDDHVGFDRETLVLTTVVQLNKLGEGHAELFEVESHPLLELLVLGVLFVDTGELPVVVLGEGIHCHAVGGFALGVVVEHTYRATTYGEGVAWGIDMLKGIEAYLGYPVLLVADGGCEADIGSYAILYRSIDHLDDVGTGDGHLGIDHEVGKLAVLPLHEATVVIEVHTALI